MISENFADIIEEERYNLRGVIGRGTWGTVYRAIDTVTDGEVAIKVLTPTALAEEQMKARNLTPFKAIQKEGGLVAARHVLPRMISIDKNGKPFIVMPLCDGTLDDILQDRGHRNYLNMGYPSREDTIRYMKDIAIGLDEMHNLYGRVHGDIKPDNIMIDRTKHLVINDLGTSTFATFGSSASPRDNMGFINTRAPECFAENSHPDRYSDVYSVSALYYRMIAGRYPLEEELSNVRDPSHFFSQISGREVDRIIKSKIKKNIPKEFRKLIAGGLTHNPYHRYSEGEVLRKAVEQTIRDQEPAEARRRRMRNMGAGVLVPAFLFGVLTVGNWIKLPSEINEGPVRTPKIYGPLYLTDGTKGEPIAFDIERELELPEVITVPMIDSKDIDRNAKLVCDDKTTAYLTAEYLRVSLATGALYHEPVNEHQWQTWIRYTDRSFGGTRDRISPYAQVAKNIEIALQQSRNPDGHVDLEDMCVTALLGGDRLRQAQKSSNSLDFRDYIEAKDSDGKYIIPKNEQAFLKQWLSNIRDENYPSL